jgi:myo-inositol-1(or 4)-monophosphatase
LRGKSQGLLVGIQGDFEKEPKIEVLRRILQTLVGKVECIRITGALAYDLASIPIGEMDARISLSAKSVDVAAGGYIVTKAGGVLTDIYGKNWQPNSGTMLAATSKEAHNQLSRLLREVLL